MASAMMSSAVDFTAASDPTTMLNNQLASALSTLGDAQFWEETISPSTIRNELSASDPSNPNSTPTLQRGMKWLLASISKGRDVSEFYPHVVKLVGATSLEVRKMVYMYLVQYADYDATTRELSLLSINSFQRGLADHEQLIRALALRVLSSIRIPDILQIQILGVQKCAKDRSPYVRKCAANALAKLSPRCDSEQREMLLEMMICLMDTDTCTMVLSSALNAFCELCPTRLDLLHTSYRKICHLLTDMDEWGQVVIIDLLARYCRQFFKEPRGWKAGTAERIDRERRVRRKITGIPMATQQQQEDNNVGGASLDAFTESSSSTTKVDTTTAPRKIKRRVVQKGFYSDEEDNSTEEEEAYAEGTSAGGRRNILGLPGVQQPSMITAVNMDSEEDMDLDEDHKLLLQCATSLLKSRNAGVVLSVCSLLYYCGVSSVKTRSAIGKALVRIHRDRREIQYVVLTSIRTLVVECPSAFAPFLHDFFVKALDPPHTRIIKIDILVSLALEPAAIEAVLKELRTYIRNGDKKFVCAAIRAVGRVTELSRIVYDRHGQKASGDGYVKERKTANRIALDCLYGLSVVTQTADNNKVVIGEAVIVMQTILVMLLSDAGGAGSLMNVEDPNDVQGFALRRILLLLVGTLSNRANNAEEEDENNDSDDDDEAEPSSLEKVTVDLPAQAVASALWLVGEWIANIHNNASISLRAVDGTAKSQMRLEIARLVDRAFPELSIVEKEQGIHFASKLLVSSAFGAAPMSSSENAICEHILSMGRVDVNPDAKDRARFESAILHATIGLKHDTDSIDVLPSLGGRVLTVENAKKMLLEKKPAPSFLPVQDDNAVDKTSFRFGTLSSLVGHQARGAYLPLPPWGKKNSPKSLREPVDAPKEQLASPGAPTVEQGAGSSGFYADPAASSDSSSGESSSSESSDGQNADSESDSSSDDDSSSSSDDDDDDNNNNNLLGMPTTKLPIAPTNGTQNNNLLSSNYMQPMAQPPAPQPLPAFQSNFSSQPSSDDESSSSDDDSSSSSTSSSDDDDENYQGDVSSANLLGQPTTPREGNLLSMPVPNSAPTNGTSGIMDDLRGLVMAPIVVEESEASADPDIEKDSSAWIQLVRPEHCGGLSVKARYLRGPSKIREAQLQGLDDPASPCVVCVQVQFRNKKPDSASLRRIRILSRSGPSGAIAVKKALCPPEIMELKKGQVCNATLCMEFASTSNREGDMVARLEIKSSTGGGVPVELKPTLGELLQTTEAKTHKTAEFDAILQRMQGFQRVVSSFQTTKKAKDIASLSTLILKHAALTPVVVGKPKDNNNTLRFIGGLPASSDLVLVLIQCDDDNNSTTSGSSGSITVCCDHALAVNSILNVLKRAVSSD